MSKPVILTNFGYQRKNWIAPLEAIKDDFEIVYIHYNTRADEKQKYTDSLSLYYSDFKNAQELIEVVKPDIFIAMGLGNYQAYAIKHICNRKGIPFVYMDHGLYGTPNDYKHIYNTVKKRAVKTNVVNEDELRSRNARFSLMTFICSFAFIKLLTIFLQLLYSKLAKKDPFKTAFHKYLSRPDAFLTYSKLNNKVNQEFFNPSPEEVHFIGNYEYDKFKELPATTEELYMLMIDNPISDNPFGRYSISTDEHNNLYRKVNELAKQYGLSLKIKLHPYNYNSAWIKKIDNTEFIKDCDINSLVKNAKYCVSFYSTLLVPTICFVPTSIIKTNEHSYLDFIKKHDFCNIYNLENFENTEIEFKPVTANDSREYKENYFSITEESSIQRLKRNIRLIIGL